MNIIKIRKKIKNCDYVRFFVKNYDEASKLEDILLKSGYLWGGTMNFKMDSISSYIDYIISINHKIDYGKSLPLNMFLYKNSDIRMDNDIVIISKLSEKQLNSLFINEPSYKPKKIERII